MNLRDTFQQLLARLPGGTPFAEPADEVEFEHAWSITARIAALPIAIDAQVPATLAELIREARALHPTMTCSASVAGKTSEEAR